MQYGQAGLKKGVFITSQAETEAVILTAGIRKYEDHDKQEKGLQQQATNAEQLSDSTILEEGEGLWEGDGTFLEEDTEIVFETPGKSASGGGCGLSSSS